MQLHREWVLLAGKHHTAEFLYRIGGPFPISGDFEAVSGGMRLMSGDTSSVLGDMRAGTPDIARMSGNTGLRSGDIDPVSGDMEAVSGGIGPVLRGFLPKNREKWLFRGPSGPKTAKT